MKKGDALTSYTGRFREILGYDAHGNITSVTRKSSTYGTMDNLTLSYDGNRLAGVSEAAADYDFAGSFEYKKTNGSQYMYDGNGSLVADKSRGITYVAYDVNNNPQQIYIDNAGDTKYVYDASGRKLRVIHQTAVPNITVPIGGTRELSPSEILSADSTDYLLGGSLTLRNGRIDKLQFEEGYCQAERYAYNADKDNITFYYYDRDHLGNVRQVITATGSNKGTVVQRMDYYPFGAQLCGGAYDSNFQSHKYNGKEFDKMHGLDTYDYGARQYNPILGRWDRMDPLCEKYYAISPYAYCGNNPINRIDPDGREIWIYYDDEDGQQQSFQYTAGMQCNVDNLTAQTIVANLNTMYENESGAKVLDAILINRTKYGLKQADTHSENGEGYFNIDTNTMSLHDVNNTLSFAEETFHIYQSVNNQGGTTAVNEVEAKLFSAKMNFEISIWNNADYLSNLIGNPNSSYSDDMISLFTDGYDEGHFKSAVNNFFLGSYSGQYYKNVLKYEQGTICSKPLIMDFLPAKGFKF